MSSSSFSKDITGNCVFWSLKNSNSLKYHRGGSYIFISFSRSFATMFFQLSSVACSHIFYSVLHSIKRGISLYFIEMNQNCDRLRYFSITPFYASLFGRVAITISTTVNKRNKRSTKSQNPNEKTEQTDVGSQVE